MRKLIPLLVLAILAGACSSIDCPLNSRVYATYALKKTDGTADTLRDTLSVVGFGNTGDTLLFNQGVDITTFYVPMSYANAEDVLYLQICDTLGNTTLDTLWIQKENRPHLESVDCTPKFFHTITGLRYTKNRIDSITIHDKEVDYDTSDENFHLYLNAGR